MNQVPAVSVIIPLYNKAAFIVRAVRSALAQQPEPVEVLVIDDGSTDDGPALLEQMPEHARLRVVRQKNAGEGAARNRGLFEMRGDLAAFLDADDEWLPGHLRDILELAQLYPDAGILTTGYRTVYRGGLLIETTLSADRPALIDDYFEAARGTYFLDISASAVRKSVVDEVGGFVEGVGFQVDLEFYARVSLTRPVAFHPAISCVYYANIAGSMGNSFRWNPQFPPVVRLLGAPETSANIRPELARSVDLYVDWLQQERALSGLCAGHHTDVTALLDDVGLAGPVADGTRRRIRFVAKWISPRLFRMFLSLRRCRLCIPRTRCRSGVVQRIVRRGIFSAASA